MNHKEKVTYYFEENAVAWRDLYRKNGSTRQENVNDLVLRDRNNYTVGMIDRWLGRPSNILDVGCGAGVTALELLHRGHYVKGIDVSRKMINLAQVAAQEAGIIQDRYSFVTGDLLDKTSSLTEFDSIVALGFFEYQEHSVDVLEKFRDLLVPGGLLIISTPLPRQLANWFGFVSIAHKFKLRFSQSWRVGSRQEKITTSDISIHRYNLNSFTKILRKADFTIVDSVHHGFANIFPLDKLLPISWNKNIHLWLTSNATALGINKLANNLIVCAQKN